MYNPFKESSEDNNCNLELIDQALNGKRAGLEKLIGRHQAWIYNIAYKMTSDINDAEDVTQEILIKMITKLSSYKPEKSAFRTWLYRITANHVINMKKRKFEVFNLDIDDIGRSIQQINIFTKENQAPNPESNALLEESKLICLNGLLLCLDRRQRLAFILGSIFNVSGVVGSEILEITEANFRKILSRSREKVHNFFKQKCGLIDERNPCRCSHFLQVLDHRGMIDPNNMASQRRKLGKILNVVQKMQSAKTSNQVKIEELYGSQPFLEPPSQAAIIREAIQSPGFKEVFQL